MKEQKSSKKLFFALFLSLFLIHVPVFLLLQNLDLGKRLFEAEQQRPQIVMVDLRENLPIVDIPEPKSQEKPKQASAQSVYDSSVKEETAALPTQSQSPSRPVESTPEKLPPKTLEEALSFLKEEQKQKERQDLAQFEPKKTPDLSMLKMEFGASGDYLPNYKLGNRTYINAEANPHVAYFVELKRKFRLSWNPGSALRQNRSGLEKGQIETVWGVSVDEKGKITGLILLRQSGNTAFDYEARRTISASSPFSSPPIPLLEKDGQLHMAWTFVVYL